MKERPILFSTPMVKAILEGRKTVTRRIIKPQPLPCNHGSFTEAEWRDSPTEWHFFDDDPDEWYCALCGNGVDGGGNGMKCRYGALGDILWVRETWAPFLRGDGADGSIELIKFKADGFEKPWTHNKDYMKLGWHWRPSIHMPKDACRLRLKILSIRVERLHDITEDEAFREGIDADNEDYQAAEHYALGGSPIQGGSPAKFAFIALWQRINGQESWDSNVWVWRIEFEKL